jgi:hypothetical protein
MRDFTRDFTRVSIRDFTNDFAKGQKWTLSKTSKPPNPAYLHAYMHTHIQIYMHT